MRPRDLRVGACHGTVVSMARLLFLVLALCALVLTAAAVKRLRWQYAGEGVYFDTWQARLCFPQRGCVAYPDSLHPQPAAASAPAPRPDLVREYLAR